MIITIKQLLSNIIAKIHTKMDKITYTAEDNGKFIGIENGAILPIDFSTVLSSYYTKNEANILHSDLNTYVNEKVAALVNSAPETLDTIGELAAAFQENQEVVEALDASITNKQDKVSDTLILVDAITGSQYKIQIQNGQLVSFPVE